MESHNSLSYQAYWRSLLIISLFLILNGCNDNNPVNIPYHPKDPITVTMDTVWVAGSSRLNTVIVEVYPPSLGEGATMLCQVIGAAIDTHYRLYDDGSQQILEDAVGFADTISGDIKANDGFFTRRLTSKFSAQSGGYTFIFSLMNVDKVKPVEIMMTVINDAAPQIIEFTFPDSIPSGTKDHEFSVVLFDSNGYDDISEVTLLALNGLTDYSMTRFNDSTWHWLSVPEIAQSRQTGFKQFMVKVTDSARESVESEVDTCWLENRAPRMVNIFGPDTVMLPESMNDTIYYVIDVTDDQGAGDLNQLRLILASETGDTNRFAYLDDATSEADTVAIDGRFGAGFVVRPDNTPYIDYRFNWFAIDKAFQISDTLVTTLVFIPFEGQRTMKKTPKNKDSAISNPAYFIFKE